MPALELFSDYSRQAVHDIFEPDTPFTPQAGTWGILGIIEPADRPGDLVLFVTFGQQQGEHEFDEGISADGVLRWQSQPRQKLTDPQIKQMIAHDETKHSIYLFLRTSSRLHGEPRPYTYLGRLKYLAHDNERQQPIYFDWQLLDAPIPENVGDRMGLRLEGVAGPQAPAAPAPAVQAEKKPDDWTGKETAPPQQGPRSGKSTGQFKTRVKPDYAGREKANRTLGLAGEKLVVEFERRRLIEAGHHDLAGKIRHIAAEEGDGAGYDILSFSPDGQHRYIEVKTTRGSATSDFFVSAAEVEFSRLHADRYELRRIYSYDENTGTYLFFSIHGDLGKQFQLTATEYKVTSLKG